MKNKNAKNCWVNYSLFCADFILSAFYAKNPKFLIAILLNLLTF
jgi:hypothetical protein